MAIGALTGQAGEWEHTKKINELVGAQVTKQAAQANSTAVDVAGLVVDFNALLVKLRAAGVIS